MAAVSRVFSVAVAGKGPYKFPLLLLGVDGRADLVRNVPGILGVEDIFHGQEHVVAPLPAVHVVVDGDETHAASGKDPLQVPPHLDVIPAESGQVLDQDAVDLSGLNVCLHLPEGGAVKVGPGIAVVLVEIQQMQLRVGLYVLLQQLTLVGDAVALRLVSILPGQAQIARRVPFPHDLPPIRLMFGRLSGCGPGSAPGAVLPGPGSRQIFG